MKQILHRVDSLYDTQKISVAFDHSRLGLDSKK